MSVLIKGMEMPIGGNETIIRIQPDGTVLDQYGHHLVITAVPVPPYGRLINADALKASLIYAKDLGAWPVPAMRAVLMIIDEMPTIIEKEDIE